MVKCSSVRFLYHEDNHYWIDKILKVYLSRYTCIRTFKINFTQTFFMSPSDRTDKFFGLGCFIDFFLGKSRISIKFLIKFSLNNFCSNFFGIAFFNILELHEMEQRISLVTLFLVVLFHWFSYCPHILHWHVVLKYIKWKIYLYSGVGHPWAIHNKTAPSSCATVTWLVCSTTLGAIIPRWSIFKKENWENPKIKFN